MQALTRCSCQKQMTGLLEYDAASPSLEPNRKAPLLLVLYRFSAFRTHGPSSNQVTPVHRADGSQRSLVNECRAAGGDLSADRAQPGDRRGGIDRRPRTGPDEENAILINRRARRDRRRGGALRASCRPSAFFCRHRRVVGGAGAARPLRDGSPVSRPAERDRLAAQFGGWRGLARRIPPARWAKSIFSSLRGSATASGRRGRSRCVYCA